MGPRTPEGKSQYTRREALNLGFSSVAAFVLAACTGNGGDGEGGTSELVDLLYDWTYNGPAGSIAEYWKEMKSRLAGSQQNAELGDLTEVAFEALFPTISSQVQARSGATLVTEYADYRTFVYKQRNQITAASSLVPEGEATNWLLASTFFDGQYWASPQVIEFKTMLVNQRHLEKAGVEVDVRFESYEHFIDACERLKRAGITPIQVGVSDGLGAESWQMFEELQVAESPADLLRGVTGEISLDAPIFSRPREQLVVLRDKYMNPNPQDDSEEMATQSFLEGSAGMMIVQGASAFAVDSASEFSVVGFPRSSARFNRPAIGTGDTVLVMEYGESKEAAGRILEFIHQPEQTQLWWELTHSLPPDARFDASVLPEPARRIWDLILENPGDPYSLWWPNNFPPLAITLTYAYDIMPSLLSGASSDETLTRTEELFTTFRSQNPDELEQVEAFIPVLEGAVG